MYLFAHWNGKHIYVLQAKSVKLFIWFIRSVWEVKILTIFFSKIYNYCLSCWPLMTSYSHASLLCCFLLIAPVQYDPQIKILNEKRNWVYIRILKDYWSKHWVMHQLNNKFVIHQIPTNPIWDAEKHTSLMKSFGFH